MQSATAAINSSTLRSDDFISGTIAAAPQIGAHPCRSHGKALRVVRGASNTTLQLDHLDITGDRQLAEIADEIRLRKDPYWGPPVYRETTQTTSLNYRVPIWNGDMYLGFVTLAISTRALSTLVKELSDPPRSTAFMLYGQDRILAHQPMLMEPGRRRKTLHCTCSERLAIG